MSYADNETHAVQSSTLVELYEFKVGVLTYRYTSADEDKTPSDENGFVWQSEYIVRDSVSHSEELNRANINVRVSKDNAIAKLYRGRPPDQTVVLTVFRYHEENVLEQDVVVYWSGRVLSCSVADTEATLICESTATSMKQNGLTRTYQGSCPHQLYSPECGVLKPDHEFLTTVGAYADNTVDAVGASAYPDDHFTGGYLNWLGSDGNLQSRMIYGHTGETLTLDWEIEGLKVTDTLWVYPGCKHNMSDCFNKFTNIVNYGGFPYMPTKNPYEVSVY